VSAVLQSGPDAWAGILPCPVEAVPEFFSVVMLAAVESDQHLAALLARTRAVQVRCGHPDRSSAPDVSACS
jgi:hypothetical protein